DLDYRWRSEARSPAARPHLEEYLRRFPELGQSPQTLADLIGEEYEVRLHRDNPRPNYDEYAARFPHIPELRILLSRIDAKLSTEFAPRSTPGLPLAPANDAIPAAITPTVSAWVDTLRRLELLTTKQLDELEQQDRFPEPRALAAELIRRG